jgi:hypothetical protein
MSFRSDIRVAILRGGEAPVYPPQEGLARLQEPRPWQGDPA